MGLSAAGNHHRRRSSVLTGAARSHAETPDRREDSLRPGDSRWDEHEPLTAEDTDTSDHSSPAIDNRDLDIMSSDDDDHYDEETGLTANQKRQRRRRRRQRRKLDARIADGKSSRDIFKLNFADRDVMQKLLTNAGLILLWYIFSLSISIVSHISRHMCPQRPVN